jgi:hypothetical protein
MTHLEGEAEQKEQVPQLEESFGMDPLNLEGR